MKSNFRPVVQLQFFGIHENAFIIDCVVLLPPRVATDSVHYLCRYTMSTLTTVTTSSRRHSCMTIATFDLLIDSEYAHTGCNREDKTIQLTVAAAAARVVSIRIYVLMMALWYAVAYWWFMLDVKVMASFRLLCFISMTVGALIVRCP